MCIPLASLSLSLPLCSLRQQLVKINHTAAGTTYKVGQNAPRGTVWELVERERESEEGRESGSCCDLCAKLVQRSLLVPRIPDDLH